MRHREQTVTGIGGLRLYSQSWVPEASPSAVVVISHGLGEHGSRYRELAERLVADGRAVYALDHRGHGRSAGPRANIERFGHVVSDLCTYCGRAARQHPDAPVFLFGHSMGGAIAFASAARLQGSLQGLVLSAPALAPGENVSALRLAMMQLVAAVAPNHGVLRLPAAAVSRDPEVVRAYETDPLVMHEPIPARTIVELVRAMATFPTLAARVQLPVLIQHGTADSLVPLAATRSVYQAIAAKDRIIRLYDGLYHEIYNEPERARVVEDLLKWLAVRAAH